MTAALCKVPAILVVASTLSGCVTPGIYERPEVPAGISWQPAAGHVSSPGAIEPWWAAFGDSNLNKLVPVVLASNNDILAASLRARRALIEAGITRTNAYPQINAGADSSRSIPFRDDKTPSNAVSSNLTLSYELDLWGKLAAQRNVASLEAQATTEDVEAARQTVVAATASVWWRLAHTNQMIVNAEKSLATARRTGKIVETMVRAETATQLETLEVTETINVQLAALERLKGERENHRIALAVLLNGASMPVPEPTRLPSGTLPEIQAGLPASLIARRPDLRAAELRLRGSLRQVDETKASFYPRISLTGAMGAGGTELRELLSNPVATLGANLVLPFLNIEESQLKLRVSKVRYEEAVVDFRGKMLTALSEVANGLAARQSLNAERNRLTRALAAQREAESIYETRLRAGSIALRPVLDAQERTRQRENALVDNQLARLLNEATLYRALGGSLSPQ